MFGYKKIKRQIEGLQIRVQAHEAQIHDIKYPNGRIIVSRNIMSNYRNIVIYEYVYRGEIKSIEIKNMDTKNDVQSYISKDQEDGNVIVVLKKANNELIITAINKHSNTSVRINKLDLDYSDNEWISIE